MIFIVIWLAPRAGKMNEIASCAVATRAGKTEPSCPLGTTRCIPRAKFPKSHIIYSLLTKFARSRWLDTGLVLFLRVYGPRLCNGLQTHKKFPDVSRHSGRCHLARSGLAAVSRKQSYPKSHIVNPLLTKFARSRWLDIGLVLFLRVYGPRLRLRP